MEYTEYPLYCKYDCGCFLQDVGLYFIHNIFTTCKAKHNIPYKKYHKNIVYKLNKYGFKHAYGVENIFDNSNVIFVKMYEEDFID